MKKSYGSRNWESFYDEKLTSNLDHLRNNANGELAPDALLEQNYKYYALLEHLNLRVGKNSSQLKIDFIWYDAEYSLTPKDQKYKQHTITFEKSCILYNIAAILSQAAKEKIDSDPKIAIGLLSKATTTFQYLSENFLNSPSVDLKAENTQFLTNLCHAEAQEVFLSKLLSSPTAEKQASLISKLAFATYNLVDKCSKYLKAPEGGVSPYGEPRWSTIMTCKAYLYRSITAYYYALHLVQENKIGQSIAFLKIANQNIVSAFPFRSSLNDYFDFEGFKETINNKMREFNKDNDYIYHDLIPSSVSIESIKPMDAIKSPTWLQQLQPYMDASSNDADILYKGIVPMEIYEKESIYSEEKAQLLRKEMESVETADLEYTSFVEFTNLPKLINDLKKKYTTGGNNNDADPQLEMMRDQIKSWAYAVQQNEFNDIERIINVISSKRKEILDILATLPAEEKENILKLKASLVEASQSDEKLFRLIKPYVAEIKLLCNDSSLWRKFDEFQSAGAFQPS